MNKLLIALMGLALAGTAGAKLPASGPDAQAKAEEAKQKTAWSDKVAAYQLCKAQDKVAASYKQQKGSQPAAAAPAAAVAPAATAAPAPAPAPVPTPAPAAAVDAAVPATAPVVVAAAPAPASAPAPVAAIPACTDPGAYVAAAAAAKVGVADSLPVPAAGKPLTPAEARK